MISISNGYGTFNYRVAAIIVDGGRVLLHRAEVEDFWSLPGGRAEMLEEAEEGLRREMREELEEEICVERLVWVCENFFEYLGVAYHELGLYFLASLAAGSGLLGRTEPWERVEDNGVRLIFEWYRLDKIRELKVNPSFLGQGLAALPVGVVHVVQRDIGDRQRMGSE